MKTKLLSALAWLACFAAWAQPAGPYIPYPTNSGLVPLSTGAGTIVWVSTNGFGGGGGGSSFYTANLGSNSVQVANGGGGLTNSFIMTITNNTTLDCTNMGPAATKYFFMFIQANPSSAYAITLSTNFLTGSTNSLITGPVTNNGAFFLTAATCTTNSNQVFMTGAE